MDAMTVSHLALVAAAPEHASAARRLTLAQDEEARLAVGLACSLGTRAEPLARDRLSAAHADVTARQEWLHWVDEGESLAPWADGDWAQKGTEARATDRAELALAQARIRQGEAELTRAVAAVKAR
jgi:hypothetical protein